MCHQRGFAPAKLCARDENEEFIKWTAGPRLGEKAARSNPGARANETDTTECLREPEIAKSKFELCQGVTNLLAFRPA